MPCSRGRILERPYVRAISTERQDSPNQPILSNGMYERSVLPNSAYSLAAYSIFLQGSSESFQHTGQELEHQAGAPASVVHDKAQIAAAQCHGARRFTGAARMYSFNAPTGTRHLSAALVPESLPLANKRMTMLTGTCSRSATWRVVRYSTVISPFAAGSWPGHSVQNNKCPLAASAETPHAPRFLRL